MSARTFTLKIADDGQAEPRLVEFVGDDPHLAFGILEREGTGRFATLWEGELLLGRLKRVGRAFWELG